jgi:hypothetical protein
MSPRGGLSDVSAGAETLREGEPAPFADAYDLAEAPVRVTLAETREQVLRSFLRERGDRGGTAPSSVDALLDSMEAARRGTSVMLVRPHERAPARASDDAFSFGRVIRSGSANVDDPDGDPSSVRGGGSAEAEAFGIDSIDTRAAARWLEHTVPIVVILLVSFLLKRAASLATFAWTTAVFLKANDVLKRGVSIGVRTHTNERPIDRRKRTTWARRDVVRRPLGRRLRTRPAMLATPRVRLNAIRTSRPYRTGRMIFESAPRATRNGSRLCSPRSR